MFETCVPRNPPRCLTFFQGKMMAFHWPVGKSFCLVSISPLPRLLDTAYTFYLRAEFRQMLMGYSLDSSMDRLR
jgi:hypothetical protein